MGKASSLRQRREASSLHAARDRGGDHASWVPASSFPWTHRIKASGNHSVTDEFTCTRDPRQGPHAGRAHDHQHSGAAERRPHSDILNIRGDGASERSSSANHHLQGAPLSLRKTTRHPKTWAFPSPANPPGRGLKYKGQLLSSSRNHPLPEAACSTPRLNRDLPKF